LELDSIMIMDEPDHQWT